jgi:hypothetical protein
MKETKIIVSDLKNEGSDVVKDLTTFLEEKTKAKVESGTSEITVTEADEKEPISRTYLRLLLRKFLHRIELKEYYRVIGGKDNTLIIKEKRIAEEEEE